MMTAKEAKIMAVWKSLPTIIRVDITRAVEEGKLYTYTYKSVRPEAFKDIDATISKLQLLGYKAEYSTVDITEDDEAVGITTDTKLTITW